MGRFKVEFKHNITNDLNRYGSVNDLKYFIDIHQYGRSAKILELHVPKVKKEGREQLAQSFLAKAAFFYSEIGWFEKTYHLYTSARDPKQARAAIYKRDNLQEKFEKIINEKYKNKEDSLFHRIKNEGIARLWEKDHYLGRAAMLQYDLGNNDQAQELIEKEGLDLNALIEFIKECKQSKIIIQKSRLIL